MLGASKERYALAVGLDPDAVHIRPDLGVARPDEATARAGPWSREATRRLNEIVVRGTTSTHRIPEPEILAGRRRALYRHRQHHLHARSARRGRINVGVYRQMLHGPARVGLYCSPGKHGRLDREAWWARGKPCEVVAAYGIDPVLFMVGAQVFSADRSRSSKWLAASWDGRSS